MMVELSKATADDVKGKIFYLQAMFPDYSRLPEEEPLSIYKAASDLDTM